MSDRIELRGLRVQAFHGVYPEEAERGQEFVIDVELSVDLAAAASTDQLSDTVDYSQLAQDVTELATTRRWNLIESVAGQVADLALRNPLVEAVRVTVHKPRAPMPLDFDDVAVTLFRSR